MHLSIFTRWKSPVRARGLQFGGESNLFVQNDVFQKTQSERERAIVLFILFNKISNLIRDPLRQRKNKTKLAASKQANTTKTDKSNK